VTLPFVIPDAIRNYWFVILFVPLALVALHPAVLGLVMRLAGRVLRRDFGTIRLPISATAKAFGWAALAWLLFGAHIAIVASALTQTTGSLFVLSIGGYALAWLVGFAVFFLPAGLGGREAVLTALLVAGSSIDVNGAVSVAVMSRVLLTATDLLFALFAALGRRRSKGVSARMDAAEQV
jgi:hypothetical protein